MAHTRHQTVTRVAPKGAKRSTAKNSDLKQAAHQGKAPVKDARNAQSGFAAVPASVATLPPGEGPPMSSAPTPAGRGSAKKSNGTKKNSASVGTTSNSSSASSSQAGGSAQAIAPVAKVIPQQGSKGGAGRRTSAKHRARKAKRG
jgi:hypothetical protein